MSLGAVELDIPGFGSDFGGMTIGGGRAAITPDMTVSTSNMSFQVTDQSVPFDVLSPGQMVLVDPKDDLAGIFSKDLWTVSFRPSNPKKPGTVMLYKLEGYHGKSIPGIWEDFPLRPDQSGRPALLANFRVVRPIDAISEIFTHIVPPAILPGSSAIRELQDPGFMLTAVQDAITAYMNNVPVDEREYNNREIYDKAMAAGVFIFQAGQEAIRSAGAAYDAGGIGIHSFRLVISAGRKLVEFASELLLAGHQDVNLMPDTAGMIQAAWNMDPEVDLILVNMARVTLYSMANVAWGVTSDYRVAEAQRKFMEGVSRWLDDPSANHQEYVYNYSEGKMSALKTACKTFLNGTYQQSLFRDKCAEMITATMNASPNRWDGWKPTLNSKGQPVPGPLPPPGDDGAVLNYFTGYLNSMIKSNLVLANAMSNNNPLGPAVHTYADVDREEAQLGLEGLGAKFRKKKHKKPKRNNRNSDTSPESPTSRAQKEQQRKWKEAEAKKLQVEASATVKIQAEAQPGLQTALLASYRSMSKQLDELFRGSMGELLTGKPKEQLALITSDMAGRMEAHVTAQLSDLGYRMSTKGSEGKRALQKFKEWIEKLERDKSPEGQIVYSELAAKIGYRKGLLVTKEMRTKAIDALKTELALYRDVANRSATYLVDAYVRIQHEMQNLKIETVEGLKYHLDLITETARQLNISLTTVTNLKKMYRKPFLAEPNVQQGLMTLTHKLEGWLEASEVLSFLEGLTAESGYTVQQMGEAALKNVESLQLKTDALKTEYDILNDHVNNLKKGEEAEPGGRQKKAQHPKTGADIMVNVTKAERLYAIHHWKDKKKLEPAGELPTAKGKLEEAIAFNHLVEKATKEPSHTDTVRRDVGGDRVSLHHQTDIHTGTGKGQPKEEILEGQIEDAKVDAKGNKVEGPTPRDEAFELVNTSIEVAEPYHIDARTDVAKFRAQQIRDYGNPRHPSAIVINESMKSDKGAPRQVEAPLAEQGKKGMPEYIEGHNGKNAKELAHEAMELSVEVRDLVEQLKTATSVGERMGTQGASSLTDAATIWTLPKNQRRSRQARERWDKSSHHKWAREKALEIMAKVRRLDHLLNSKRGLLELEIKRQTEVLKKQRASELGPTTLPGKLLQILSDTFFGGLTTTKPWREQKREMVRGLAEVTATGAFWWTGFPQVYYGVRFYHAYGKRKIALRGVITTLVAVPLVSSAIAFSAPGALAELVGIDRKWLGWFGRDLADIASEEAITQDAKKKYKSAQTWRVIAGTANLAGGVAWVYSVVLPQDPGGVEKGKEKVRFAKACEKVRPVVSKFPENTIKKILVGAGVDKEAAGDINDAIVDCDIDSLREISNSGVGATVKATLETAIEDEEHLIQKALLESVFTVMKDVIPDPKLPDAPKNPREAPNVDTGPDFLDLAWKLGAIGLGIWFLTDTKSAVETVTGAFKRVTGGSSKRAAGPLPGAKAAVGRGTNVESWTERLKQARAGGTAAQERDAIRHLQSARDREGKTVTVSLTPQL